MFATFWTPGNGPETPRRIDDDAVDVAASAEPDTADAGFGPEQVSDEAEWHTGLAIRD